MYDDVATLIKDTSIGTDRYGNPAYQETRRLVYVQLKTIYAKEFYAAAQAGLKPEIAFVMSNRADYNNETEVEYNGNRYEIIRVDWKAQRDSITLICTPKGGNFNG